MPYDDPDPTDPMTLHGVGVETDDENATVDMAECFIEEFVRMGFSQERLLRLFENPGYAGPHRAYRILGEDRIAALIDGQMRLRGFRIAQMDQPAQVGSNGLIQLRVLE